MSGYWPIGRFVYLNPRGYELANSRRLGTVYCSLQDFAEVFGAEHDHDPGGEKVSHWWYFETPRGRVVVRNYHLNPRQQLTIAANDKRAALWAAAFFRRCKLKATGGTDAR